MKITIEATTEEINALVGQAQERLIQRHDEDAANRSSVEHLGSAVRLFWRLKELEDESEDNTQDSYPPASEG